MKNDVARSQVQLFPGDALDHYRSWPRPVAIVSDGAYGVSGFPSDPPTYHGLAEWYEPHIAEWSRAASGQTTLWFWNTEIGWATVHPVLLHHGWEYRNCHIWNKGVGHIAGNANSLTLRKYPVVTEVCVQYVKEVRFPGNAGELSMKEWLRYEWERSGLPLNRTNEACGVKNAATRKYFTTDHLWYYPPVDAFEKLVAFANRHGRPAGRPYFSIDGLTPLTGEEWGRMRAKFRCEHGITNVWDEPPMRGDERLKDRFGKCLHLNQKPTLLLSRVIRASTDEGDMVWEPFGGLCSVAVTCVRLKRECRAAEINADYFRMAKRRMEHEFEQQAQWIIPEAQPTGPNRSSPRLATLRALRARKRDSLRASSLFPA